jgi:hypothetical protein
MHSIPLGTAIAVAAALLAVAGVCIALIQSSQKKHQARLDLLRYAVERGMTLDVELIAKLAKSEVTTPDLRPRRPGLGSRIAGILTIAYGAGFAIFACFIGSTTTGALVPMLGVASLFVCMGAGFLIVSRVVSRDEKGADPPA